MAERAAASLPLGDRHCVGGIVDARREEKQPEAGKEAERWRQQIRKGKEACEQHDRRPTEENGRRLPACGDGQARSGWEGNADAGWTAHSKKQRPGASALCVHFLLPSLPMGKPPVRIRARMPEASTSIYYAYSLRRPSGCILVTCCSVFRSPSLRQACCKDVIRL